MVSQQNQVYKEKDGQLPLTKTMYLKIANLELAKQISQAMYELSVLDVNNYQTKYLYNWVEHKTDIEVLLDLREDISLYINPNADVTKLDVFLQPLITNEELVSVHQQIELHKGSYLRFVDFIPPSLSNRILTEQDLIDNGWYLNTDI